jgi:hypothetical protein
MEETVMEDRSRVLTAACAGAVVGGIWGWLYLTEKGRSVRDQIGPGFDRLLDVLGRVQATGENARTAIVEGQRLVTLITALKEVA